MDRIEAVKREIAANENALQHHRAEIRRLEQEIQYARERLADMIMPWSEVVKTAKSYAANLEIPCHVRANQGSREIGLVVDKAWVGKEEAQVEEVVRKHGDFVRALAKALPHDVYYVVQFDLIFESADNDAENDE